MSKQRRTFSAEFKLEAAALVLDHGYSCPEACKSVGVGETVIRRWVDQVRAERGGITPQGRALTPELSVPMSAMGSGGLRVLW